MSETNRIRYTIPNALRRKVLDMAGSKCQFGSCTLDPSPSNPLCVHHINGDKQDHRHENLTTLCRTHHNRLTLQRNKKNGIKPESTLRPQRRFNKIYEQLSRYGTQQQLLFE